MSKKTEEGKSPKRKRRKSQAGASLILLTRLLGALIGREIHRYEVKHLDDIRIRQLIQALEKKPVKVEIYPLVPFRIPGPPSKPTTNGRLDRVAKTSGPVSCIEEDYLCPSNLRNGFHLDTR